MPHETLELFDITPPRTSARSKLILVDPMGKGTPLVEALTSLLVRTANAHVVRPTILFNRIVLPITKIELYKYSGKFFNGDAGTMNSYLKYSRETVTALEALTLTKDLDRLTLMPWKPILNRTGAGALRKYLGFCPRCLDAWRREGSKIYYPLAWHLRSVRYCPTHEVPLLDRCPHCNHHQSILGQHNVLGHCTGCGHWLGAPSAPCSGQSTDSVALTPRERFHQDAVLEMLEMSADPAFSVSHQQFLERLRAHIDILCGGMVRTFGRRFGFSSVVGNWFDGKNPRLDLFLEMCHRLQRTPRAFLFGEIPQDFGEGLPEIASPITIQRKSLTAQEIQAIESGLTAILGSAEAITQLEAAKRLGMTRRHLNYRFPDLATKISQKHKAKVREDALAKLERKRQVAREVTIELMSHPRSISRRKIGAALEQKGVTMADPEVRTVVKQTVKDTTGSSKK